MNKTLAWSWQDRRGSCWSGVVSLVSWACTKVPGILREGLRWQLGWHCQDAEWSVFTNKSFLLFGFPVVSVLMIPGNHETKGSQRCQLSGSGRLTGYSGPVCKRLSYLPGASPFSSNHTSSPDTPMNVDLMRKSRSLLPSMGFMASQRPTWPGQRAWCMFCSPCAMA